MNTCQVVSFHPFITYISVKTWSIDVPNYDRKRTLRLPRSTIWFTFGRKVHFHSPFGKATILVVHSPSRPKRRVFGKVRCERFSPHLGVPARRFGRVVCFDDRGSRQFACEVRDISVSMLIWALIRSGCFAIGRPVHPICHPMCPFFLSLKSFLKG